MSKANEASARAKQTPLTLQKKRNEQSEEASDQKKYSLTSSYVYEFHREKCSLRDSEQREAP
ncbi:MAG: hypothetical protein ACO29U_09955 [Crocinitomicaceae bacterium]